MGEHFFLPSILDLLMFDTFQQLLITVRGKYDSIDNHNSTNSEISSDLEAKRTSFSEGKEGEVSHFQALATAVSGTVGNGNNCWGSISYCSRRTRSYILDDIMWSIRYVYKNL